MDGSLKFFGLEVPGAPGIAETAPKMSEHNCLASIVSAVNFLRRGPKEVGGLSSVEDLGLEADAGVTYSFSQWNGDRRRSTIAINARPLQGPLKIRFHGERQRGLVRGGFWGRKGEEKGREEERERER